MTDESVLKFIDGAVWYENEGTAEVIAEWIDPYGWRCRYCQRQWDRMHVCDPSRMRDFSMYEEDADETEAMRVAWEDNAEREESPEMTEEELARAARFDREENG